jgi:transcriptional regulator with XRE-family HTH domain
MSRRKFADLREKVMRTVPDAPRLMAEERQRMLAEIDCYGKTLAEIRRARAVTQVDLARSLNVSQAQVSRLENQADLYLSSLEKYLAGIGGRLELTAVFEDGTRIPLTLADLTEEGLRLAEQEQTRLGPPTEAVSGSST